MGNQNRYATGFTFEVDDIIIFDGSVDSSFKPDDYVSTNIFTQLLVIDSSGQVWGYSYDDSSSGGGADVTVPSATLSLTSEEDEVVIPDGITAISYTLNGESITRQIAVEPTDKVKFYKEDGYNYYTLAIYDSEGTIKSKGYTMHSNSVPSIAIEYSADINNNFTASDEYNGFGYVAQISDEALSLDTEFVVPAGICSVKYNMPESGGGAVTVKTGNILKYTVDTSDSTKFTLSLYDKNKNKKRDLYTWCNDNVTITYGTDIIFTDTGYIDITKVDTYDFLSVGQSWSIPDGTHSLMFCDRLENRNLFRYNFSSIVDDLNTQTSTPLYYKIKSNDTEITMSFSFESGVVMYKLIGNKSGRSYMSFGHPSANVQYRILYGEYLESCLNNLGVEAL